MFLLCIAVGLNRGIQTCSVDALAGSDSCHAATRWVQFSSWRKLSFALVVWGLVVEVDKLVRIQIILEEDLRQALQGISLLNSLRLPCQQFSRVVESRHALILLADSWLATLPQVLFDIFV